ncbi:type II toxin-antitoxin system HicB family antitoxin [Pseudooceanicola nanhaiensis]|nr:type II toxin-antitoxin system HicB family antitoxin [Pseudooceanicola nanhaiensis]
MKNAIAALDDYAADAEVPAKAMPLGTVREKYAEDTAEGAYLIMVPLIRRETKIVRANLSFERGLLEAIDEAADRAGLSRSAFLDLAARHMIEDGICSAAWCDAKRPRPKRGPLDPKRDQGSSALSPWPNIPSRAAGSDSTIVPYPRVR